MEDNDKTKDENVAKFTAYTVLAGALTLGETDNAQQCCSPSKTMLDSRQRVRASLYFVVLAFLSWASFASGSASLAAQHGHSTTLDPLYQIENDEKEKPAYNGRACGYAKVKVSHADRSEMLEACEALRDTLTYFKNIGFQFDPRFTLVFRDGSGVEIRETGWAGSYFDRISLKVFIFRDTAYKPWGMPRTPEISASFLRHEIVHTALVAILDDAYEDMRPEWHEFIAYAVQIDLMSEHLRDQLLMIYPATEAFPTLQSINEFTYGGDPDGFSVAAYKTYMANGGSSFIEKLVRFEIVPPSLPLLFLEQFLEQDQPQVQ